MEKNIDDNIDLACLKPFVLQRLKIVGHYTFHIMAKINCPLIINEFMDCNYYFTI